MRTCSGRAPRNPRRTPDPSAFSRSTVPNRPTQGKETKVSPRRGCGTVIFSNKRRKDRREMKKVELFTDGACRGNPGPGGWGCILTYGKYRRELSGGEEVTTNNRMELTAAIEGLSALKEPCEVTLTSDSRYLVDAVTLGSTSPRICTASSCARRSPTAISRSSTGSSVPCGRTTRCCF